MPSLPPPASASARCRLPSTTSPSPDDSAKERPMSLRSYRLTGVAMIALMLACPPAEAQIAPKAAEPATTQANAELAETLPFANRQDFDDAMRGFVGTLPDALIPGSGPRPTWNMKGYEFLKREAAPDTVNPSLWRQAQLNAIHGLFQVTDRVYQVRGFDISNM